MLLSDLRYAFRVLTRRPASSAAIVLTLALALGVNSTLFMLVNAPWTRWRFSESAPDSFPARTSR
jgi:hypothetical protein